MVVKLKSQGDLDKETREYEKTHKKKVDKASMMGRRVHNFLAVLTFQR